MRDREVSGREALDHDGAGVLRQPLTRQRREQLVLPIAGDAGDAQDFTAFEFERNMLKPDAMRLVGLQAEVVDHQARDRRGPPGGGLDLLDVAADHHASQGGRRFLLGVAGCDLLAAAQDGRGVADPLHLFELVADVEDGAALGFQSIQHHEELVGLLRCEHGRRFVQDEKFGVLHQRPNDFDALAFAHRELPDLTFGVQRQPVIAGDLLEPRGDLLELLPAVEPERDVFRDREIVEQREVLEHHADAERARLGRPGEDDLLVLASASRRRSAGSGHRWS